MPLYLFYSFIYVSICLSILHYFVCILVIVCVFDTFVNYIAFSFVIISFKVLKFLAVEHLCLTLWHGCLYLFAKFHKKKNSKKKKKKNYYYYYYYYLFIILYISVLSCIQNR